MGAGNADSRRRRGLRGRGVRSLGTVGLQGGLRPEVDQPGRGLTAENTDVEIGGPEKEVTTVEAGGNRGLGGRGLFGQDALPLVLERVVSPAPKADSVMRVTLTM